MAFWGNPVTTGSQTIDYYLSADIMESPFRTRISQSDEPYTEQVLLIEGQGIWYFRPLDAAEELQKTNISQLVGPIQVFSREDFGLSPDWFVFLLPQSVFKIHPLYDLVLLEILKGNPAVHLAVTAGRRPTWTKVYVERLMKTFGIEYSNRLHVIERVSSENFYNLLKLADVILHPFPFDGSRTSADALLCHIPIVTLPTEYLRGRMGYAFLRTMNISELVASDIQDYIKISLRLSYDKGFYDDIKTRIINGVDLIWEDMEFPFRMTTFLQRIMDLPMDTYESFLVQSRRSVKVELERSRLRAVNALSFDSLFAPQTWQLNDRGQATLQDIVTDQNIWPRIFEHWREKVRLNHSQPTLNLTQSSTDQPTYHQRHNRLPPDNPEIDKFDMRRLSLNVMSSFSKNSSKDSENDRVATWYRKFRALIDEANFAKAIPYAASRPEELRNNTGFLLDLGLLYFANGDFQPAFDICSQLLPYAEDSPQVHSCVGISGMYLSDKEEASLTALKKAVAIIQRNNALQKGGRMINEIRSDSFSLGEDTMIYNFNLFASLYRYKRYNECTLLATEVLDIPEISSGGAYVIAASRIMWSLRGLQLLDELSAQLAFNISLGDEALRVQSQFGSLLNNIGYCLLYGDYSRYYFQAVERLMQLINLLHRETFDRRVHSDSINAKNTNQVNLIIQYFIAENKPILQEDMNIVLMKNLANPFISRIFVLTEMRLDFNAFPFTEQKLVQIVINKRLTFQDAFKFANQYLQGQIVMIGKKY